MGPRPTNLDLGKDRREAFEPPRFPFTSSGMPSPRTGEVPPALSPLDAFAMQSRMLAKRFEDERGTGRRVSRLPPTMVAKELSNRPGYFRNLSDQSEAAEKSLDPDRAHVDDGYDESQDDDTFPEDGRIHTITEEQADKNRPTSMYPIFGTVRDSAASDLAPSLPTTIPAAMSRFQQDDQSRRQVRSAAPISEPQDYFGINVPRAMSPEPVESRSFGVESSTPSPLPSLTSSFDTLTTHPRTLTNESQRSQRSHVSNSSTPSMPGAFGLIPPPQQSPRFPRSPRSFQSIRSVPPDSGDEDTASINGSHSIGRNMRGPPPTSALSPTTRKFSGSSGMSRPQSPFSPWMQPVQRSPSMTSDHSTSATSSQVLPPLQPPPRSAANFSRPMSSAGRRSIEDRPSLDMRPSFDSRPSYEQRPPSIDLLSLRDAAGHNARAPSFTSSVSSRQNSSDDIRTPYAHNVIAATPESGIPPGEDYFESDFSSRLGRNAPTMLGDSTSIDENPSATYTYAKYALPRGRAMERVSAGGIRDSWIQRQFNWDKPAASTAAAAAAPTSAPNTATFSHDDIVPIDPNASRFDPALSTTSLVDERGRIGRALASSSSAVRSRSADPRALDSGTSTFPTAAAVHPVIPSSISGSSSKQPPPDPQRGPSSQHRATSSTATESTDRTIRATPLHQKSASADLTADEHLDIGIAAHSAGETTKSTYHLRLAAIAGLPTAMLLYALACRHGWGMRPQPEEGVRWLRKAVASAGVLDGSFITSTEARLTNAAREGGKDSAREAKERKERSVQYALAIYELGISSQKGWGCPKDKKLALRCFEIAGEWGDADALAEAGFCYAQGVGCKKDLKKAAGLYRKAEEKGMSMAGNSWIYKAKYMDDSSTAAAASPSTSHLFGSNANSPNPSSHTSKRPDTAFSSHTTASSRRDDSDYRPDTAATNATSSSTAAAKDGSGRARSRSIWGRRKDKGGGGTGPPGIMPVPADLDGLPAPHGSTHASSPQIPAHLRH